MSFRYEVRVAVISAPRPNPTIGDTLASLTAAGYSDVTVFYDGESRGCYLHFRRVIEYLWRETLLVSQTVCVDMQWIPRGTKPQYFLVCEDDVRFTVDLRKWLDSQRFEPRAIYSLYTAPINHNKQRSGWHRAERLPKQASGALAYLIPLDVVYWLVRSWPHTEWADRTDHAIGLFCRDHRVDYYTHTPSLASHLAVSHENSALESPGGTIEGRQCVEFAENLSHLNQLLLAKICL